MKIRIEGLSAELEGKSLSVVRHVASCLAQHDDRLRPVIGALWKAELAVKGEISFHGMKLAIENPVGSVRHWKWPDGTPDRMTGEIGRPMVEHNLNISERKVHEFETTVAVVNIQHPFGSDEMQRNQRMQRNQKKASGRSSDS